MTTKTELRTLILDHIEEYGAIKALERNKVNLMFNVEEDLADKLLTLLEDTVREVEIGWTIELPNLPFFQIKAFDNRSRKWDSHIYETKNLPLAVRLVELKEQPRASSRQAERSHEHGTQE